MSHQHDSKNRGVFLFGDHGFKSAVNLAIEEPMNQAVKSRNDSSSKTKHPSWTVSGCVAPSYIAPTLVTSPQNPSSVAPTSKLCRANLTYSINSNGVKVCKINIYQYM